jgi:hypothetical protein
MRTIIAICLAVAALFWVDHTYFSGIYAHAIGVMLQNIVDSFR